MRRSVAYLSALMENAVDSFTPYITTGSPFFNPTRSQRIKRKIMQRRKKS